ncbi:DUF4301 family protein [Psychroflexus sediminis]|uniref:DUF4301 domain-containing protein n=1 Tax=Psychroflexus sediminis TaxID=470826 RepID=A0A1G7UT76_9FLAO|nr:DUF4301 family protein [Psychroflexus sediminis]SDG50704.1 protein of unknown function [Psychroflexus sediminis]
MKFHPNDLSRIQKHELTAEKIEQDLEHLKTGFPKVEIVKPATLEDGIIQLKGEEKAELMRIYQNSNLKVLKFVPASGAASRMFRLLHQFQEEYPASDLSFEEFLNQDRFKPLKGFFESVENLAFYDDLKSALKQKGIEVEDLPKGEKALKLTRQILAKEGFCMSDLPKGLVPFHKYSEEKLTAFEEHFYEALKYAEKDKKAQLHFTISTDHFDAFQEKLKEIQSKIKDQTKVNFQVDFSFQHPSTDTVCIDASGDLFRDKDGKIVFRPAGHGALVENLNQLKADIVFIKNIDNVSHQNSAVENITSSLDYKSVLAGLLIQLQEKAFALLKKLERDSENQELLDEAVSFLRKDLNVHLNIKDKQDVFYFLNRPIRVCGMVENTGEPGGGPFWIKNEDDSISLQIVEKNQIDLSDPDQKEKMEASTHFNPVDIVCSMRNYRGEAFDLKNFVDRDRGFVADKFVGGEPIKGLELPGLWNGGMALWNTVFVEVPVESFNPVKAVMDLLKPGHQPQADV